MKRKYLGFALPVLLLAAFASVAAAEKSRDADDSDLIRERIRLYLQRHGDNGVIDPERRRLAIARDYAVRRAEEASRRLSPLGIGGSNWVSLGPTNGAGRVTAIAPHPSLAGTVYVGAAGGGVWKTSDGGVSWTPLTDGINDLSVGALAVAPSSPNILYLGTGEGGYAIDFIPGIGMLTSNDGGATWALPSSVVASTFYRISVHPGIPLELVAGTNQGGLRSTDGGTTWTTVISRTFYGDVADIVRHPTDPRTLYAATWCVNSCAAGIGKVLKSTDGGATWAEKSFGLPTGGPQAGSTFRVNERVAIAISATDPLVLYAATGLTDSSGNVVSHIYRTANGGESWADLPAVSSNSSLLIRRYLASQSWYNNTLVVSPTDPNTVIAGGTNYVRTTDGGATFSSPPFAGTTVHVDAHDMRYQGTVLYIGNDGGVWASLDGGLTAAARNDGLVVRQFYALAIDPVNRNRILAGAQDNGTSQRTDAGGTLWRSVLGADGFECAVNPLAPDISYGTIQFGTIHRSKNSAAGTPAFSGISPPFSSDESTPFLSVLTIDPANPSTIYTGSYRVWKSDNGGDSWLPLPTATADASIWPSGTLVTAIALSRSDPTILMVAKSRSVFRSADGGRTWVNASSSLPAFTINNIEIDPTNASVAYAALATTGGNPVYWTTNGGLSWTPRGAGLPPFAAQVVRVDPTDSNDLFCGTDVGVFRSTDQGASWARFGAGLPSSSVHDIRIFEDGSALRAATHGRGVWELDIPPSGNTRPSAVISSPASAVTVARGSTLTFSGAVTDPDPGDTATGTWIFPDTWESIPAAGGPVSHTFTRPGVFPVSLAARDGRGGLASASVAVTVPEASDSCATPVVLPGAGPFPYTVLVNNESAANDAGDPTVPTGCAPGAGSFPSVWFEFTPAAAGMYEFSTCGSAVDTVLSVFTGPACGPYTPVAGGCNDDAPTGSLCEGTQSSLVTVSVSGGQTVRIQITGFLATDLGTFPLTVRPAAVPDSVPRVTGLSRFTGTSAGGTSMALYGFGFGSGTTVTFGGVAAQNVNVLDSKYLTLTTPDHLPGLVDIIVTAAGGSGKLAGTFTYVLPAGVGPCAATSAANCLNGGRFKVGVSWRVPSQGTSGVATAVPLTSDTGYFWFFSSNNVELVVKVVDGRAVNNRFWVFYGALSDVEYTITVTDTATGAVRTYFNPAGTLASGADTSAFDGGSGAVAPETQSKVEGLGSKVLAPESPSGMPRDIRPSTLDLRPLAMAACTANATTLCLNSGRFSVQVSWRVPAQGTSGIGAAVPVTSDTGYFWFFSDNNIELVLKVVDGRAFNNKFWVFYGALSDVEYTITVTDTESGAVRTYFNPSGTLGSVADTSAF